MVSKGCMMNCGQDDHESTAMSGSRKSSMLRCKQNPLTVHTGRYGLWQVIPGSQRVPFNAGFTCSVCNRTGNVPSSYQQIRSSLEKFAILLACTLTHPIMRWCCVIFPRNSGHPVKNYIMIQDEVFYEKQSKEKVLDRV